MMLRSTQRAREREDVKMKIKKNERARVGGANLLIGTGTGTVPINSSPSTTTSKNSHQLRYIVVFIPTLKLGSGLVCHVDLQVSRLSPQHEFWPG